MLLINCSNREKNCYKILSDIKTKDDKLISLSNKDMKFCLGCEACQNYLPKYCILNDYITNKVYDEILRENTIIFSTPMYMSNINGILKNLLDRFNPFYNHNLLKGKKIYLLITGYASKEDNEEDIHRIIDYFNSIKDYLYFKFEFLDYFGENNDLDGDINYNEKIDNIKQKLNNL